MTIKVIPDNFNPTTFNHAAHHPLQAWEWGEARKEMGVDVLRIGEFDRDVLKNVFQVTFHNIPYTPFTIGYLPRSVIPSQEMVDRLRVEGRKRKAIFIKIEPYVRKTEFPSRQAGRIQNSVLRRSSHPLFPKWTQILDLALSEDDLLKNMKSKTRYNIRLAEKKGATVKEMTNNEGFKIFSKLYFNTTKRQSYHGHTHAYHKQVFESLKKNISHILIAFYKDVPLAAYHLFHFDDILYYPYGGSSTEHRNLMASNLLMWEAIKFGKQSGAKMFDMWGSLPEDYEKSGKWSGFTRFKEGYGTEFVEFVGSYDLVINKPVYVGYNIAHKIRQKLL